MRKLFSGLSEAPELDGVGQSRAISILFFGSGFAALLYQLIWQRALFSVLGVDIEAITIVVAAFMVGLGLGSLFGGALSRQLRNRGIILLSVIEAATCLYGFFSLEIFQAFGTRAIGAPPIAVAAIAFLLIIVPTLLMGASLPILASHVSRVYGLTGRSVGTLYYSNTLGAALACLCGSLLIFPAMGMEAAVRLAAAINATVAVFAYMLSAIPVERIETAAQPLPSKTHGERISPAIALAIAFIGGFVALSYQIYLVRLINVTTGGLAATFATVLGASLCGLAGGSRASADVADQPYAKQVSHVVRNLSLACFLGAWLLPILSANIPGYAIKALLVLTAYAIARSFGCVLPFLAQSTIAVDENTGRKLGWLYLFNIFGAATGGIITGFIVFDILTVAVAAQFLALLCILVTLLFLEASRGPSISKWPVVGIIMSLTGAINTPSLSAQLWHRLMFHSPDVEKIKPIAIIENRSGVIAVTPSGDVFGAGTFEGYASTQLSDAASHTLVPYALGLVHPSPRRVLLVGLSSGSWARILADNPSVQSLVIVEPNPGFLELLRLREDGSELLRHPKVNIVIDDPRRFLRTTSLRFEAIVQSPITAYREHASILLSQEYVSLGINRLSRDGVFIVSASPTPRFHRTACSIHPRGYRLGNTMIVGREPIAFNFPRWATVLRGYAFEGTKVIKDDKPESLARLAELMTIKDDLTNPHGAAGLLESCESILLRTNDLMPITDDNMGTEWRAPIGLD